jgi:hypothetical protein
MIPMPLPLPKTFHDQGVVTTPVPEQEVRALVQVDPRNARQNLGLIQSSSCTIDHRALYRAQGDNNWRQRMELAGATFESFDT